MATEQQTNCGVIVAPVDVKCQAGAAPGWRIRTGTPLAAGVFESTS